MQWWDKDYQQSEFSEVASFELGLLRGSDWIGKWISKRECKEFRSKGSVLLGEPLGDYVNAYALYVRNEYVLRGPVSRARAYVCGLGYYELRINGKKTGDRVLDPAQTDYKRIALYSTYDVTGDLIGSITRKGSPRFAVGIILGNGRHIKNYDYDHPKVLLQLVVEYDDGGRETFASDSRWKMSYGPLQENGLYYGERYDARLEMPGWDEPGFDDDAWERAVAVDGPSVTAQAMAPIRAVKRLQPEKAVLVDGGCIYDFGQNIAGWVRISVEGNRGTEVRLRHAELLNDDGTLNVSPNQNAEATDLYILRGGGPETYEPRFTYHGFRYAEITGVPGLPALKSIEACFVHTDVEETGQFSCSNALINRIHRNILWGQLANLMSIPTDCTQRDERQGWLGDAHLAAEQAMFNFDMAAFYTKFLDDVRLAQKEDGSLPDTVPPYLRRLYPADPAWSSAYITIAWYVYVMYGDHDILERHYESMKKYVMFLHSSAEDYIVKKLGKYGDWCPPGSIAPKRTPVELTSTWYFYHDTLRLSQIASVLSRNDDAGELRALALHIRDAFNRKFLEEDEYAVNRFAPVDRSPGQTSNALPLVLGHGAS